MTTLRIEDYFEPKKCSVYRLNASGQMKKIYGLGEETLLILKTMKWKLAANGIQTYYDEPDWKLYIYLQLEELDNTDLIVCLNLEKPIQDNQAMLLAVHTCNYFFKKQLINLQNQQKAWYEGMRALTSSLELTELLSTIIDKALTVLQGVVRGFFTLYDEELQLLIPIASAGFTDSIYFFKTKVGEGIAGKTFEDGIPRSYTNEEADRAIENLTPENYHHLMVAMNNKELGSQISMAAPVRLKDKRYGVLVVHQISTIPVQSNLQLLQSFADQAAIAIRNAQLYTEMKQMNENLMKQQQIHDLFTEMSLKNYGIQQIVKASQELIDKEVVFLDVQQSKLYPQHEQLQNFFRRSQQIEWLQKSPTIMGVDDERYYVQPVFNNELLIGYFFVKSNIEIQLLDSIVLKQAGVLIALKIVNTQSLSDEIHAQRREFFNELITSKNIGDLYKRLSGFGLDQYKSSYVMLCRFLLKKQNQPFLSIRMQQFIERLEYDLGISLFSFKLNDQLTIVLQNNQNSTFEKLHQSISYFQESQEGDIRISIGGEYNSLAQIHNSYDEAKRTMRYLNTRSKTGVMRYTDLGIGQLFVNQEGAVMEHFISHIMGPLQTPKNRAIQLEETLRAYIENNRSIGLTAKQLHIHQNTLYHRLHKIEELLEVNLNDWNDYLELSLAIHLQHF
ncbi:helix-turn-helix domain-containing protein [Rummeliibacillus sp. JY-2-4R]